MATFLALAACGLAAPGRADIPASPAFYVSAVDDAPAGLPGDRSLFDLEGVRRWVSPAPFLTNHEIADAYVRVNEATGVLEVALELTRTGSLELRDYTAVHGGGRIAFVLDGAVLSAPVVVNRLSVDTIGIWDKTFDRATAERFAARIRAVIAEDRGRGWSGASLLPQREKVQTDPFQLST